MDATKPPPLYISTHARLYDAVYELILYIRMDMSLMRDFMFVACTSGRSDEERQPVRSGASAAAGVQRACTTTRTTLLLHGVTYWQFPHTVVCYSACAAG